PRELHKASCCPPCLGDSPDDTDALCAAESHSFVELWCRISSGFETRYPPLINALDALVTLRPTSPLQRRCSHSRRFSHSFAAPACMHSGDPISSGPSLFIGTPD